MAGYAVAEKIGLGAHIWVLRRAHDEHRREGLVTAVRAPGVVELDNDPEAVIDLNLTADFGFVAVAPTGLLAPVGDVRMDAYYYGFEKTGVGIIDALLSAVATAGKRQHSTEYWADDIWESGEPTAQATIQAAADAAARAIRGYLATERVAEIGPDGMFVRPDGRA